MGSVKSLGKLVARLVDEVALCGKAGARPKDIITLISAFYNSPSDNDSHSYTGDIDDFTFPERTASTLDDAFIEYVWRLLIRDPEISLGENHLDDVASAGPNPKAIPDATQLDAPSGEGPRLDASTFTASTPEVLDGASATGRATQGPIPGTVALENASAFSRTKINDENVDDWTEGAPFPIPSSIARAHAEQDLVEPSSRYEKRLFASESQIWHTIAGHEPDYSRIPGLDFICLSIIATCGPQGVAQNDLVRLSGQDKRSLPMRTDRLHENGYIIKRPVTIFQNSSLLHTSLLALKRFAASFDATAVELTKAAAKLQKKAKTRKKRAVVVGHEQSLDSRLTLPSENVRFSEHSIAQSEILPKTAPQWTPYRNLWNQVFDVVHQSGTSGLTLIGISTKLMGSQYRKPMEELLAKFTNSWQLSQPLHLRGLAIVRDSVQRGKTSVYLYHTRENYQLLVDAGQRTWEAVLMLQDCKETGPIDTVMDAHSKLDQHGFPSLDPSRFQGLDNNAPLIECVPASSAFSKNFNVRTLVRSKSDEDATTAKKRSSVSVNAANFDTSTKRRTKTTAVRAGLGRPRKYTTVGIPVGIELWKSGDIKGLIESRRLYDLYQKTKITDEIQRRAQQGEQSLHVARELLEVTDAFRKEQGQQPMSRISVMQILHEYAGEAEPLQEDETMLKLRNILKEAEIKETAPTKPVQRMLLMSPFSTPDDSDSTLSFAGARLTTSDSTVNTERRPSKAFDENSFLGDTMVKDANVVDKETLYWNLPSVAAHSKPHGLQAATLTMSQAWTKTTKTKKRGRPRQLVNVDGDLTIDVHTPKRRKTAASNDCGSVTKPVFETPNSTPSVPTAAESQEIDPAHESSPTTIHSIMFERYRKSISSVSRPRDGVFVARPAQRYRRRHDPISTTSKKYQVAIFRLTALKYFDWFTSDRQPRLSSAPHRQQSLTYTAKRQASNARPFVSEDLKSSSSFANRPPSEDDGTLRVRQKLTASPYQRLLDNSEKNNEDATAILVIEQSSPIVNNARELRQQKSASIISPAVPPSAPPSHLVVGAQVSISKHPPETDLVEYMNKDPAPLKSSQDPCCYIFKFPSLQGLNWFRHGGSQSEKANHSLLQDQADMRSAPKVQHLTASEQSNSSHSNVLTKERQQSVISKTVATPRKSKVTGTSGRTGGSTAILRREIVMQLVKICGGVFPEASAMRVPFSHEWKARGQSGIPEKKTIINAVNMCCEQGKLRRIVFSFKDRSGITATSTVFTIPEIDPADPKVRDVQEMIKMRHPQLFVPDELKSEDAAVAELKKNKRLRMVLEAAEKQAKVVEARAIATKSLEEREAYLAALKSSDRSEQEKAALSGLIEPSTRKVQRLETIKRPMKSSFSLPASKKARRQQSLSRGKKFSTSQNEANSEVTIDASQAFDQSSQRVSHPKKGQDNDPVAQSDQIHQRKRRLASNTAQVEVNQRSIAKASPHFQHGTLRDLASSPTEYVVSGFMGPTIETQEKTGTFSASYSGNQIAKVYPELSLRGRKRKQAEIEDGVFPGFMDPSFMYHRATGTFSTTFFGFRRRTMKANLRGKRRHELKNSLPHGYEPPFRNQQLEDKAPGALSSVTTEIPRFPGFMSPDALHPISGTFAINFLGFRPVRPYVEKEKSRRGARRLKSKLAKEDNNVETLNKSSYPTIHARKRHRAESVAEGSGLDRRAERSPHSLTVSPFKLRIVRGPQTTKSLGEDGAFRLSIAVMVVRILTGGIRMNIDWTLVAKAFAPLHDEDFLRSRWSSVLTQMRHNQVKMDTDFQTLFAKAYQEGAVPKIDFEYLEDYNWKWLVEWTMVHLDAPSNSVPELLVDRQSFNIRYTIGNTSQEKDLAHFFELEGNSIKDLRKSIINRQAYVSCLFPTHSALHSSKVPSQNEQTAIARSWIRANIVTPIEAYNSQVASSKLNALPATHVEAALKSLLQEKMIVERHKSHFLPGREYEMSDYFERRLRTNICPAQFHRAVAFKAQLDLAIKIEGRARWSHLAHDGDAMALLNLVAHRRVTIVPIDPPLNEWGHTDDGYASRQMDKSKLNFEMEIVPTSSYAKGNPLDPLPPPPAPRPTSVDQQFRKIPLWYDMNDNLMSSMWASVLAAVLGLLAIRSGATVEELHVNVSPSLEVWEVGEILNWMVRARVAEVVGRRGYRTQEWWWMVLREPPETILANR